MRPPSAPALRIVHLEDDLAAFKFIRALLIADGIEATIEHVVEPAAYRRALAPTAPDLILSDFNLPSFDGLAALAIKRELCPDTPFIFVSGALGEETAVQTLRNGATDFVLKSSLTRLPAAVRRALAEASEHLERLRAEQSLRTSEERFRRLTANAPDAIFRYRLGPNPGYEYISSAVGNIVGYSPEEFYADPALAARIAHPQDGDVMRSIARSRIVPLGIREIRWITRDGRTVVTEQRFVPVRNALGQLVAVEGIARDISERRHSEEQIHLLSEAIDQSPVGVLITGADNRILFANSRLLAMSGREATELIGREPAVLLSSSNPPDLVAEMWSDLGAGRPWQGDFLCQRANGEPYNVRASIAPVFGKDGRVKNFLAIHEDVTQARKELDRRRVLEAQLYQAQKMETIGTLAGGIAHDFNNILTGILGFTEIAGLPLPEGHPAIDDLDEVRKAGLRAKDLVAQILTFARQKGAEPAPLQLSETVAEALRLVRASAPATIEIERDLQPGQTRADATAIHQIVLNLCTNAVHAMRGAGGKLTVRIATVVFDDSQAGTSPELKPGAYLCLSIRDTGHGMDAATLNRLFEPFFTTKKIGEGTGLGLALVRGIVNAHKGALRVSSTPGIGTTFEILLPVCNEAEPKSDSAAVPLPGRGERVAVIDDEESVATFVGARLEQLSYRATVFSDSREALAALRASPARFDLVVTDLAMPHLNGLDLMRSLRTAGVQVPAVVMSGMSNHGVTEDVVGALGRLALLPKPFNGDDLARAVRQALDSPGLPVSTTPAPTIVQ